jgi:hypothetical protein
VAAAAARTRLAATGSSIICIRCILCCNGHIRGRRRQRHAHHGVQRSAAASSAASTAASAQHGTQSAELKS